MKNIFKFLKQERDKRSFFLEDKIVDYISSSSTEIDRVQKSLIDETANLGWVSRMQISPDQGNLLTMLVKALRPNFAVEVGTFTGYSALSIAKGLPANAKLLCCDVSETWTNIAKQHWKQAGVDGKIDLILAPALETLEEIPEGQKIDFAFIDADKGNYINYYESILNRLSENGLIVVDNVLWSGRVVDDSINDEDTVAIRNFNQHVKNDERVLCAMLSIGDGVSVIQKKP
ncbi:MAG TPA: class I SAM-dependent methyltransferase [Acidimicrobiales bacterium]|nr:class I SAM-dependent methyltransferase [Acidimicrobiales bacterium]